MEGAGHVVAVERDTRCIAALAEISEAYPGRLTVIEGDALTIDPQALPQRPARVVANLPYNVGTPLLVGWLSTAQWPPWYDRLVLMFQKEVALRITAPAASADYGRLSVLAQWRARCRLLFDVSARAFTPPPKVTSAVVEIVPGREPADAPAIANLEAVTAKAFGQRRKMLRQSLRPLAGASTQDFIRNAGLDPTMRAEQVPIDGFVRLARDLAMLRETHSRSG